MRAVQHHEPKVEHSLDSLVVLSGHQAHLGERTHERNSLRYPA